MRYVYLKDLIQQHSCLLSHFHSWKLYQIHILNCQATFSSACVCVCDCAHVCVCVPKLSYYIFISFQQKHGLNFFNKNMILTPSLPQPVKFPSWNTHSHGCNPNISPSYNIFLILCILMQILWHASAENRKDFRFLHFISKLVRHVWQQRYDLWWQWKG